MKSFFRFFLITYVILSTGLYVLSCMAPFINPCHSSMLYFSGMAFPFVFINFLIIGIYLGFIKKKFIFLFLLIPGIIYSFNFISLNPSDKQQVDDISVYSFNAHSGKLLHQNDSAFNQWLRYIKEDKNHADIICLQEFHKDVSDLFPRNAKYNVFAKKKSHLKIASTFPIGESGELKDSAGLRFAIYSDLVIDDRLVRVYNFHLFSNQISSWLESANNSSKPNPEKIIKGGEKVKDRIFQAAIRRAAQAKKLRWHMEACPHPIIACGDMNETAQAFSYMQVKGNLDDSFAKGKPGLHSTYRKNPSWVRIDYIFADKSFETTHYEILPFEISDHSMVRVALRSKI